MAKYVHAKRYSPDYGVLVSIQRIQLTSCNLVCVYEKIESLDTHATVTVDEHGIYGKILSRRPKNLPEKYLERLKFLEQYRKDLREENIRRLLEVVPAIPTDKLCESLTDLEIEIKHLPTELQ